MVNKNQNETMNLELHTQTVTQIINGDVVNIQQMRLSPEERTEAFAQLMKSIADQSGQLAKGQSDIPAEKIKMLAERVDALARSSSASSGESPSNRTSAAKQVVDEVKSCFGGIADIVLNAVKLLQITGLM